MLPLFTRKQARALDADAIERLGVPGIVLMENAGAGAAQVLMERFSECLSRVVIVGGPGQNGGDAWVVARQLWLRGFRPRAFIVSSREQVAGDARVNLDALEALGCEVQDVTDSSRLQEALNDASVIVDGLFGTGLARPLEGLFADAVAAINAAPAPTFALDLPSGVDADSGAALGSCVQAAATATFAGRKRGLYQYPARAAAGHVSLVPIGVPVEQSAPCTLIEDDDVKAALASRAADAHKGTAGHVLVVAGSEGKTGAALLAGQGALRAGAGLVTLATRKRARAQLDGRIPELMTTQVPDSLGDALGAVQEFARRCGAAVLGPGFGVDRLSQDILAELAVYLPVPAVLDADALTALSGEFDRLRAASAPRVLTPHPGEAARLLGTDSGRIQSDRYAAASALAERSGQVVVLKGAGTVVAHGGHLRVCDAGTPAMGAAGMGDVLSGIAGALLVGRDPFEAATAAVQLHARAGELAAQADCGLLASELAAHLPRALSHCRALTS